MRKDYHINIFYSEEDGGYIADIPDLEACSAYGDTPEEALAQVELAKAAWLATARAEGMPIPKPTYRPAIYQGISTRNAVGVKFPKRKMATKLRRVKV